MASFAPFKGITYDFHKKQDISKLITPPYDVISEKEQEKFYEADPHNIIRLILGKRKVGDSDWDNQYTRAADNFRRWEADGVFIRAERPSMYLTSLTYDPGKNGPPRTRWGLIALVKIEEEDSGVILPHEKTFSAHKDDRLRLYQACDAQFSQIFGLFEDQDDVVINACKEAADEDPVVSFDFMDGTGHQMWPLENRSLFKTLADLMSQKTIFIADGHHRYETSRNYRNIMRKKYGRLPDNKSYEYVMMYLSNMNDEGLTILPAHRLAKRVPNFQMGPFLKTLESWFDITDHPFDQVPFSQSCGDIQAKIGEVAHLNTAIAFCVHGESRYFILSLKAGAREKMGDNLHTSLKKLDVIVLSKLIFQEALGFTKEDMDNSDTLHYRSNMETALNEVESGNFQMAFLLNPTKIEHVQEIAGHGLVMPRKSTYFYPKVLTGLVLNKIDPNEIIEVP